MRGDAVFGDLVHRFGADLQFDALISRPDHGGVERAVVVLLGRRDVVLEAARDHRPGGVDDAERAVALADRLDDHAKPENVGQLLEADRLALHLAPDRIRPLAPSGDDGVGAEIRKLAGELLLDLRDQVAVAGGQRVEALADQVIGLRIELPERQVLELLAQMMHAHAAGERRIDIDRLLGDAGPAFRRHVLERAHVVQAVGELDQQHPHVVGDRQQKLAEILRLLGLARHQVELFQLGEAFDQMADIGAENLVDLGPRGRRVLDGVVQERRRDGGVVELEVGQNGRDFERMAEIGVAGGALLLAVGLHGVDIGAVEQRLVGVGIVAADPFDQVVLPHHRGRVPLFLRCNSALRRDIRVTLQGRAAPCGALHARQIGLRMGHRDATAAANGRESRDSRAERPLVLKISRGFDTSARPGARDGFTK